MKSNTRDIAWKGSYLILAGFFLLLVPLRGQMGPALQSYRESISKLSPMDTDALDADIANILERYYKWTFESAENWDQVESIRFDGILYLPGGSVRFVAFKKKPDYSKVVIFLGGKNRIVMAYDGRDAWKFNTGVAGAEPTSMPEEEARHFIRDAPIGGHLVYPRILGKRIELLGVERVGDRPCYKISVTLPDGERIISYLDTSNFAELRQTIINGQDGAEEHNIFNDFRGISGIRFPFATSKEAGGEELHRAEITRIQLNLGVMPWMFQRASAGFIPGDRREEDGFELFEEIEEPITLPDFGQMGEGQTAFPDPKPIETAPILETLGKRLF